MPPAIARQAAIRLPVELGETTAFGWGQAGGLGAGARGRAARVAALPQLVEVGVVRAAELPAAARR